MLKLLFAINVDWYFELHWQARIKSDMTDGFEVEICLASTEGAIEYPGYKTRIIGLSRSSIGLYNNFKSLFSAREVLKESRPDIIHSVTIKPNLFFGLLARLYSLPILITIPGLGTVFSSTGLKYRVLRTVIGFMYRIIGKNSKSYFAFENREDRQRFLDNKVCSGANSCVVPGSGVNIKQFSYVPEAEDREGEIIILFAARLLRGKGLDDLVQAVRLLNRHNRRFRLDVAGIIDDDTREAIPLAEIERLHGKGEINWLGQVQDMPALLAAVHVVALPTRYGEGLPRILLEAAACGRPVVTTDMPGCREFVKDGVNGRLVTPGSVEQLSAALASLQSREERVRLGLAGRQLVEQEYTQDKVVGQYRSIYNQLVDYTSRRA